MKKFLFGIILAVVSAGYVYADMLGGTNVDRSAQTGRPGMVARTQASAPSGQIAQVAVTTDTSMVAANTTSAADSVARTNCMNRNQGVRGDTFVWAGSINSGDNFSSLIEDVRNPSNNACWVKVNVVSTDPHVQMNDVKAKYYPVGSSITCGSWVNEKELQDRVLEAKKTNRALGTVAGAVGGAAVGVGAMELFGNKAIGGKVMGQKALSKDELLYSQMTPDEKTRYDSLQKEMSDLCAELKKAGGTSKSCE